MRFAKVLILSILTLFACSCAKSDDSALWQAINKNSADIAVLNERCSSLNNNIDALSQLIKSINSGDCVTEIRVNPNGTGYLITFQSGKTVEIKDATGSSPQIGVGLHSDGLYYWTLNGSWLYDQNGNMIRAEGLDGKDGTTPKFKIENGDWYVSTDNGSTWIKAGKATGDNGQDGKSFFKNVIIGEDCITFILDDGKDTEIKVPFYSKTSSIAVTGGTSKIGTGTATVYGNCSLDDSGSSQLNFGMEYAYSDLTRNATSILVKEKSTEGDFSCQLSGLLSNTLYYYRCFAVVDGERVYGEVKTFKTSEVKASVSAEVSDINYKTATISGKLSIESEGTSTTSAILYYSNTASTLEELVSSGIRRTLSLNTDCSFSTGLTSLAMDTQYNYVVIGRVDGVEFNTGIKEFRTKKIQATITAEASEVGLHTATISGKLAVEYDGTKSAILYYSNNASTLDELKAVGTKKTLSLTADGSFSISLSDLLYLTRYEYVIVAKVNDNEFVSEIKYFTTADYQTPPLVDLGLSVKWASYNLGATSPEEFGDYYAWGETETKSKFNNSTYKFYKSEIVSVSGFDIEYTGFTKYIPSSEADSYGFRGFYDNKSVLDPEDDVAHVKLGGKWRMPTKEEYDELKNNCQCDLATYKGVNGMKITSNKAGYTDKWIFLPMAGYGQSSSIYVGKQGNYWSSSLGYHPDNAHIMLFDSGGTYTGRNHDRNYGCSVRPVSE